MTPKAIDDEVHDLWKILDAPIQNPRIPDDAEFVGIVCGYRVFVSTAVAVEVKPGIFRPANYIIHCRDGSVLMHPTTWDKMEAAFAPEGGNYEETAK